jgi:DNA-binding LacI/PurR family transcriptional regulator
MKKKISIHDMAKGLHLSATTISFVLNGKADEKKISEDVRRKVSDYIMKVGYQPNLIAKSLRTGKTNIIGMLVEDISDPFFSSISRGMEEGLKDPIIFATNYLAINGLKAICNLKLSIPDDIAVVGFDDNKLFYLFTPSITAVAQPVEKISEEVVKQLPDALSDDRESKKRRTVTLPIRLIERNSSLPRSKARAVMKKFEHKTKTVN